MEPDPLKFLPIEQQWRRSKNPIKRLTVFIGDRFPSKRDKQFKQKMSGLSVHELQELSAEVEESKKLAESKNRKKSEEHRARTRNTEEKRNEKLSKKQIKEFNQSWHYSREVGQENNTPANKVEREKPSPEEPRRSKIQRLSLTPDTTIAEVFSYYGGLWVLGSLDASSFFI